MDSSELQVCITNTPSYLKELLRQEEEICLAYNKKNGLKEDFSTYGKKPADCDSTNLDLTGSPLIVDLYGDTMMSTFIFDKANNWTEDEMNHVPVSIAQARKFINEFNRKKAGKPVYAVCDGNDKKQTVVIGAKVSDGVFMRCLVFIVGIFPSGHYNLSVDYMKQKHIKNTELPNAAVQYNVISNYNIYGYNLLNCPAFVNIENRGSILMEVSWKECTYRIPKTNVQYQITSQVIIGHTDSQANTLWKEMNFLENCINLILQEQNIENGKLNQDGKCLEDLIDAAFSVLSKRFGGRSRNQEIKKTLDFKHLRDASLVDNLWDVLKESQTVSDLRRCFHHIFEYIADLDLELFILDTSNSIFNSILRGIVEGKIAVPTLTHRQSLEIFIEHGLEKLKNDYLCIFNHFCSLPSEKLMTDWSKLSSIASDSLKDNFSYKMSSKPDLSRRTRTTFNLETSLNTSFNTEKLKHLARMHVIVEFFLLFEDHANFPTECFECIGEYAYNKFMGPNSTIQNFSALEKSKLCDLTLMIDCIDSSVIEDKTPVKFRMQMTSKCNFSEITTVFLHSESPVFPTVVFNNYDLSLSYANEKVYYITELVQYTNFFK